MEVIKAIFSSKSNLQNIGVATGGGILMGIVASTLVGTPSPPPKDFQQFEYLNHNEEVMAHLQDLKTLLLVNGRTVPSVFFSLCGSLNVLIGYDFLIDTGRPLSLDLNYTIQSVSHLAMQQLTALLKLPFRIVSVGSDICGIVEKLQEEVSNVVFNMNHEIRLRIMDSNY